VGRHRRVGRRPRLGRGRGGVTAYRPPRDCPVCSSRLEITQLGCPTCGTGLTGSFESCDFCGLDPAERDLLRVFLASRGNMKELERHLGVSYPTARARFEDLLRRLGLSGGVAAGTSPSASTSPSAGVAVGSAPGNTPGAGDPRLEILRAVAAGDVEPGDARDTLAREAGRP
ncbi:MAG TPA: DUF2089 family protein, partial [Kineosporiaceae bacterium]